MPGPHPAVAAVRAAVRRCLADVTGPVVVAVSGGADSLALAAAVAFECDPRRPAGLPVVPHAVIVDHGLQASSDVVAQRAARTCRGLGMTARVVTVEVGGEGGGGPESRARTARYTALEAEARACDASAVLLGHTRDDQAEQVLLGLARGSGARSLAGMPPRRGLLRRPLLEVDRATTRAACAAEGLEPWEDPHNADPRFLRVRARRLLTDIESVHPGLSAALARSAALLRDDADALDELADRVAAAAGPPPWSVADLHPHPAAVRRRVWRRLLLDAGVPAGSLTATHLGALDDLVVSWHGQGPVDLPGGHRIRRFGAPARLDLVTRAAGDSGPKRSPAPAPSDSLASATPHTSHTPQEGPWTPST